MLFNRRNLLVAGSSVGVAVLLYGCGGGSDAQPTQGAADTSTPDAEGEVALYDGSQIEPIDSQPINNPPLPDRPMGGVNATVTIIEYVSPTCPHCAAFHATVLPQIKETYIDTGRIRFIQRPFRLNVLDLAVFMVAEAAGERYNEVLGAYLDSQNEWAAAANPRQAIFEVAERFGFTQERFEEVLTDEELLAALEATREQALELGLQGTPTFYINGAQFQDAYTFEALSAAIDQRL